MISTSIFLLISLVSVCLFIGGFVLVYYGHTLGFMANILSLMMIWTMTALSAFGSVGDTVYNALYSYNATEGIGETTISTMVNLVDPALVYIALFTAILCTVVFILILVRFVMDNIRGKNPEMEDESI